jgi:hypothetical protein
MEFSTHISFTDCILSWGSLEVSSNSFRSSMDSLEQEQTPSVYLVMGRDRAGQWYEVSQSYGTSSTILGSMSAKLVMVRLVAVGEEGILARNIIKMNGTNCEKKIKSESPQLLFKPVLSSSSTEDSLVKAKISWPENPSAEGLSYLVRWQAFPGDSVLATLYVNTTTAILPLRRNAHYMVEVQDLSTESVSLPIIIDTSDEDPDVISTYLIVSAILMVFIITALAGAVFKCRKNVAREVVKEMEEKDATQNNNNTILNNLMMNNIITEEDYYSVPFSLNITQNNLYSIPRTKADYVKEVNIVKHKVQNLDRINRLTED